MTTFHLHTTCPRAPEYIRCTMTLENAERVPDGPTEVMPCPACGSDTEWTVHPGRGEDREDGSCRCGADQPGEVVARIASDPVPSVRGQG